jgi:hypothetical protein
MTKLKGIGGMVWVVELLPSKYKALNSNHSTAKHSVFKTYTAVSIHFLSFVFW